MSVKNMFFRLFRSRPVNHAHEPSRWYAEAENVPSHHTDLGGPADIPMRMWKAEPEQVKAMAQDLFPTAVIPKIAAENHPVHNDVVAYRIERSYNDVDAVCSATNAVRMGNWEDALEGLLRYAALHPNADMMPVAA